MKKDGKRNKLKKEMRPLCCPQCGRRVMVAVTGTKAQLVTPMPGRYPDFILKCGHCGTEIGVIKTDKKIE